MFKLMKYELRRNLTAIIILYTLIFCLEAYALYSMYMKDQRGTGIAFGFLIFGGIAAIMLVFIVAIQSYSKELGSKYSYMTFMTPTSTYGIIGSKLLSTGFIAAFTTIIAILLIVVDYNIFINQFPDIKNMKDILTLLANQNGLNVNDLLISVLVNFIVLWINLFTSICIAYLSITLSATVFSNKRFRGVISFIIFIALNYLINWIAGYLPIVEIGTGVLKELLHPILSYLLSIIAMIGAFLGSGLLLDKKVSL